MVPYLAQYRAVVIAVSLCLSLAFCGCQTLVKAPPGTPNSDVPVAAAAATAPRELDKSILPTYTVEPPDILTIEAIYAVPKQPYRLRPLDVLVVQVLNTIPDAPIQGAYTVEPGGDINLGLPYGRVRVTKLTVDEATEAIQQHVALFLREPEVSVSLAEVAIAQQIAGEHLVGPDGSVTLGSYGNVKLVGLSLNEAKKAIEAHLSEYFDEPEVSISVFAYNSKTYYVITQGAGLGDGVFRFPVTGNETVLDAISQIQGLETVSSKRMWIARPSFAREGCDQVLPIDWRAITRRGIVDTNYQVLPGDRIYIAENKLVALDSFVGKAVAPFERMFGFTTLGTGVVSRLRFFSGGATGGGGFGGGF